MRFLVLVVSFWFAGFPVAAQTPNGALLQKYCVGCHNNKLKSAGVSLQGLDPASVADKGELLERVLRKIKAGQIPPAGLPRPDAAVKAGFTKFLEGALDAESAAYPN